MATTDLVTKKINYTLEKKAEITELVGLTGNPTWDSIISQIESLNEAKEQRDFYKKLVEGRTGNIDITAEQLYDLVELKNYLFQNTSIKSVELPNKNQIIGSYLFDGCSYLTRAVLPNNNQFLSTIPDRMFSRCSALTTVNIPTNTTTIGNSAFSSCSALTSINLPTNLTTIKMGAFQGCSAITALTIPSGVTVIGDSAFSGCSAITALTIPSGVTEIKYATFEKCSLLATLNLPASITKIGTYAFKEATALTSINFVGTQSQWNAITKDSGWNNGSSLTTIHCSDGDTTL